MNSNRRGTIVGTGFYVPEKVVPNSYFNELYNRDMDTFLRTQRNIFERRWMAPEQTTSDLIIPAAQDALKAAGIQATDLDLIIVSTDTPDYLSPATACVVQHKLQATKAFALDINSACAGFVVALDMANKFIQADKRYQNVLVVGAYAMSKWLNMDDYKISSLFADGASAAVVQPSRNTEGVLTSEYYVDGQYHDYMGIYGGGAYRPITQEVLDKKQHLLDFAKKIPIETNGTHWPRLTLKLMETLDKKPSDIKHFFMTQINIQSINEALDNLKLPRELSHNVMDRFGYTGSSAIGMAIADAVNKKKLKKGDLIVLLGSGGGLSMAACAIEWGYDT
jgi:3-oxoacyl-[acyl-carrier-protein] synthase III